MFYSPSSMNQLVGAYLTLSWASTAPELAHSLVSIKLSLTVCGIKVHSSKLRNGMIFNCQGEITPGEWDANSCSFSLASHYFDCAISCSVFKLLCYSIKYTTKDLQLHLSCESLWNPKLCHLMWSIFSALYVERLGLNFFLVYLTLHFISTSKKLLVAIFLLFSLAVKPTLFSSVS